VSRAVAGVGSGPGSWTPYSLLMALTRFTGRHALVTGAASGIGRATALRLATEGAQVMAVDVNAGALEKLEVDSQGLGGAISALVGDVSSEEGVIALVRASVAHLGSLDVVVNVAGVLSFSHTHEVTLDEWSRLIAVNLTGTFLVCRESLPHLLASRGNIVNLASTAAHKGQPWATAYVASKGGVLALTRALAVEYAAQGVRANSISPGAIDTPITGAFHLPEGADAKLLRRVTPLGPFGTPEGIAAAIAYVASDEAAHMNGADLLIDGATLA
jgi:meso-butanediol dehydrogenase/(S,S)-butanediol dehydrogenase/diacetyl reductase